MNIKEFRKDNRARAFFAISKAKKMKIIIVEGKDDVIFYRNYFTLSDGYAIYNSNFTPENNSDNSGVNRQTVLKIREIINNISSNHKNIAFIIDKDYKQDVEEGNLFITDYYSIENYVIVNDEKNINFQNIEMISKKEKQELKDKINLENIENKDLLKFYKGKDLWKLLKRGSLSKNDLLCSVIKDNVPIIKRIENYFSS
ncbi:MAG: DUF4435 domain-containing protein [Mycoplasmatales bacterium]|nr:DUF4435 domain-containing protein [Mycoplasmatales bacterium]